MSLHLVLLVVPHNTLFGGIEIKVDADPTLRIKLGHSNSLIVPIYGTPLISDENLGQMIDSVRMFELLRSGGAYRGLLQAHLGFLLLQVK